MAAGKPIGSFYVQLGLNTKEFQKNLRGSERELKRAFGSAAIRTSELLAASMAGLAAGLAAVGAASIKLSADLEVQTKSFQRLLGGADAADKKLRELQDFAAKTPFTFTELVEYTKRLLAIGYAAEETKPLLTTLGDTASGIGLDAAGMGRLIKAFGDIKNKGALATQELNQLAEAGVGARQILADGLGKTILELMDMVENRTIDSATAITLITEGLNRKFGGMMAIQAETMIGMMSTVKDETENILRVIGAQLVKTFNLEESLRAFRDSLSNLRTEIEKSGLASTLWNALGEPMRIAIIGTAGAITGALIPAVVALKIALVAALLPLAKVAAIGATIALIGYAISKAWDVVGDDFKKFAEVIKFSFNEELPKAVEYFFSKMKATAYKAFADVAQYLFAMVQKLPGEAANYYKPFFADLVTSTSKAAVAAGAEADKAFKGFKFAEALTQHMNQARVSLDEYGYSATKLLGIFDQLKTKAEAFWGPQIAQITGFAKAIGLIARPVAPVIAPKNTGGATGSGKATKNPLIDEAKQTSKAIEQQWINATQTRQQQLDYQLQKEIENLNKSKSENANYARDLERINEVYRLKKQEIIDNDTSAFLESVQRQDQEYFASLQERDNAFYESFINKQNGYALEQQLMNDMQASDLESYISHLGEKEATFRAHLEGNRELANTYGQLMADAYRSDASYMAEAYQSTYGGLSDALTGVITRTKEAGAAFQQLGMQMVQMVVRWMVQQKLAHVMSEALKVSSTASSITQAAATAAAWMPAAMAVSIATMGRAVSNSVSSFANLAQMSSPIPFMANGAIAVGPTLAMVGEGGESEAILPLSKLDNMLANSGGNGGGMQINVFNNSGVPVSGRANQRTDGGKMVIDLFIDGFSRNVSGIQGIIGGRS